MPLIDPFTKLYDKSYLERKDLHGTYMISFDLKQFKSINDRFGHDIGDHAIQLFARLLKECFSEDIAIHRSGDEFVVISQQSLTCIKQKLYQLENILKKLNESGDLFYLLEFNAGICPFEQPLDVVLRNSDLTMYEAKKENQLFREFDSRILEQYEFRKNMLETIDMMLSRKSFSCKQIPIYDLQEQTILREYRLVSPLEQMSIFQDVSLLRERHRIEKIDLQGLERAILEMETTPTLVGMDTYTMELEYEKICSLLEERTYPIILDINIDREIRNLTLLKKRLKELTKQQIPICLNSLQVQNSTALLTLMDDISISYIKVDSDFRRQAMTHMKSQMLLKNMMNLCQDFHIIPIFKGVATNQEIEYLKKIGEKNYYRKN